MHMFLKMVFNQARHRWPVTVLVWLAMTALVSLYVYSANSARFSNRSMQLVMKQMGHNLLIVPGEADPLDTYLCTDRQIDFADETTEELAAELRLYSKYYVSVLQERMGVDGAPVILTGVRPVARADETREKGNLLKAVPVGRARLGAKVADVLGLQAGDRIDVGTKSLEVAEVLSPQGSLDDYRVYVPLQECQAVLGKPGRINAIWSFLCMHGGSLPQVLARQQRMMAESFPHLQVITKMDIAQGRDLARRSTSGYLNYLVALVLGITVVIIAVTGLQEVTERTRETGIMLAMGGGYLYVIGLYIAKILALAVVASVTGFLAGSLMSKGLLTPVLITHTRPMVVIWGQLPGVAGMTCLVAVLAGVLPMVKLVRLDPSAVLTEG